MAEKKELMRKAFDALAERGVLVTNDTMTDDEWRRRRWALLMSRNMLVQMDSGSGYTGREFDDLSWENGVYANMDYRAYGVTVCGNYKMSKVCLLRIYFRWH